MSYMNDEWWDEDDVDYGDWDDDFDPDYYEEYGYEEPPLTLLERIGQWLSRTWIGRYWRARYELDRSRFDDPNDIPI